MSTFRRTPPEINDTLPRPNFTVRTDPVQEDHTADALGCTLLALFMNIKYYAVSIILIIKDGFSVKAHLLTY